MGKENQLCKKFLLSANWDRAVAALLKKDEDNWSARDYINLAHALCFQATKAHSEGNYDDAVAAASKAQIKDCKNNDALCIRAYAYYLNNNYEAAITDCERVIERAAAHIAAEKQKMKDAWENACDKMVQAEKAKKAAEEAEKNSASDKDKLKQDAQDAAKIAETAVEAAKQAQANYCTSLRCTTFAHELLGIIYSDMDRHLEASEHYKLALLAHQTDIVSASPLLMDAYRNARATVKGF